jgi:hypothetical protein
MTKNIDRFTNLSSEKESKTLSIHLPSGWNDSELQGISGTCGMYCVCFPAYISGSIFALTTCEQFSASNLTQARYSSAVNSEISPMNKESDHQERGEVKREVTGLKLSGVNN